MCFTEGAEKCGPVVTPEFLIQLNFEVLHRPLSRHMMCCDVTCNLDLILDAFNFSMVLEPFYEPIFYSHAM
jgi:hypothetical protein